MNNTNNNPIENQAEKDRCAETASKQLDPLGRSPFVRLIDEGNEKSRLISATADILGDLCAADSPSELDHESVSTLMRHVLESADRLNEIMEELCDVHREQVKSQSDAKQETKAEDLPDFEQIAAATGEWEDIQRAMCRCLESTFSAGYDAGRKAGGES